MVGDGMLKKVEHVKQRDLSIQSGVQCQVCNVRFAIANYMTRRTSRQESEDS